VPLTSYSTLGDLLKPFLDDKAVDFVSGLIGSEPVSVTITRQRRTRHGDFRWNATGSKVKITVNRNLGKPEFLITLLHEIAHYFTWKQYGNKARPHGTPWKDNFAGLLQQAVEKELFHSPVKEVVQETMIHKRRLGGTADRELSLITERESGIVRTHVNDLLPGAVFSLENGLRLRIIKKLRTRFFCQQVGSKRLFYVPGHLNANDVEFPPQK
jgi:SprT protein